MKPNLLASLKIKDFEADSAIVVASSNILESANGDQHVYVVDNNDGHMMARKVVVETGASYQGRTLVLPGELKLGMQVLDEGSRSVISGDKIELK